MNQENNPHFNRSFIAFVFVMSLLIVSIKNVSVEMGIVFITLIGGLLVIRRHQVIFATFLIASIAWGASVNLALRMGNVMPSDFMLAILFAAMSLASIKGEIKLRQVLGKVSNLYLLLIIGSFLAMGIVKGYAIGSIFQDFKLFLYIYVPYLYLRSVKFDKQLGELLLLAVQIYICVIFLQELLHFREVGLDVLVENGFGQRNVMIIVQFLPVAASVLYVLRNQLGFVRLTVLQVMAFIGCFFSFTRTIWIAYILALFIAILFEDKRPEKLLKKIIIASFSLAVAYYGLINLFPDKYHQFHDAIISRITDSTNSTNTLSDRMDDSAVVFEEKVYRFSTIFGSGFGEIWSGKNSVFIENSFFYYLWKYGLIATVFFIAKIGIHAVKSLFAGALIRIVCLNIVCFMIIGNFSGNLNLYYCAPVLSFAFAYGYIHQQRQTSLARESTPADLPSTPLSLN
ncbi:hypothetical protein I8J29_26810 [Paenibacillus sp. MWE-103]|uniref:O-antigen ligase-like membrane protein n=1 Tax=Paenibacillus artemisiicola TaxID=1172618 RepID=A0ABS3WHN7_9BACL|nr:hypothetical protein [Paenibacillus artemisiicola]MBO7747807.1 hypothetical protein [Paenibacillus artemisiicola]